MPSAYAPLAAVRPLLLGLAAVAALAVAAHAQTAAAPPAAKHRASCFDAPYGSQAWQGCEQANPDAAKKEHRMRPVSGQQD